MDVVPLVICNCLKFPHEGSVHIVQDTLNQPLVACGDFLLDHFWPTSVGPMLSHGDLLYRAYY